MSINLRRHWKLLVVSITAAMVVVGTIGGWRVSAFDSAGTATYVSPLTNNIENPVDLLDDSIVHEISITYDQEDFELMRTVFETLGTKTFLPADVTIDGVLVENIGIRLKGNSTLFSLGGGGNTGPGRGGGGLQVTLSWDEPEGIPFLVSFDEYEDDQTYQGLSEVAIRVGGGQTAATDLAEALAYASVDLAGAPAVDGTYAVVQMNDSKWALHYVVETIDEAFADEEFSSGGVLYKATAEGSYDYIDDDPLSYADGFDQITGINESSDANFVERLDEYLDVEALATYVAVQNLFMNFDDMAGPGNNSYLWYDLDTELFTILAWDLNLAFTGSTDLDPDDQAEMVGAGGRNRLAAGGGAGARGRNILKERFLALDAFDDLYETAYQEASEAVYGSGTLAGESTLLVGVIKAANDRYKFTEASALEIEFASIEATIMDRAAWLAANQ